MPIFEYRCRKCDAEFERIVFGETKVDCPECGSKRVERIPSAFGIGGSARGGSSGCSSCKASSCRSCGK